MDQIIEPRESTPFSTNSPRQLNIIVTNRQNKTVTSILQRETCSIRHFRIRQFFQMYRFLNNRGRGGERGGGGERSVGKYCPCGIWMGGGEGGGTRVEGLLVQSLLSMRSTTREGEERRGGGGGSTPPPDVFALRFTFIYRRERRNSRRRRRLAASADFSRKGEDGESL